MSFLQISSCLLLHLPLFPDRQSSSFSEKTKAVKWEQLPPWPFPTKSVYIHSHLVYLCFLSKANPFIVLLASFPPLHSTGKETYYNFPFCLWYIQQCPENCIPSLNTMRPLPCIIKNIFTLQPPLIFSSWPYLLKDLFTLLIAFFPFYLILRPLQSKFSHHHCR